MLNKVNSEKGAATAVAVAESSPRDATDINIPTFFSFFVAA